MLRNSVMLLAAVALVAGLATSAGAHNGDEFDIPSLPSDISAGVTVDGDLSDWKDYAFTEGHWTLSRMLDANRAWFSTQNSWLGTDVDHGPEGTAGTDEDLGATFYAAWDDNFLYVGMEATDNAVDNSSSGDEILGAWTRESFGLFIDAVHDGDGIDQIRGDYVWFLTAWETPDARGMPWLHGEGETANNWTLGLPTDQEYDYARPPVDPSAFNFDDPYGANYSLEVRFPHASMFKFSPEVLPIGGKTMGGAFLITSSDGEGASGREQLAVYMASGDDGTYADFTFVQGEGVAVETASWRSIKAMFK